MAMSAVESSETQDEAQGETVQPELSELIRDHPWIAVLGAATLGFVLARIVRGQR
jgi:ElaB/YqjD/DUF883 family membrane-anchored ribosome-binding protein